MGLIAVSGVSYPNLQAYPPSYSPPPKAALEARDCSHERFTAIQSPPVTKRIGAAKGKFTVPDNFDEDNEMIAEMLTGGNI